MPLSDTITALDCVVTCDTLTELDDPQFLDFIIDALLTATGTDLTDIEPSDLTTAVENARCDYEGSTVTSPASPQTKKAIILHLVSQL